MGEIGLSIKLWRLEYDGGGSEFKNVDSSCFIIPDGSPDTFLKIRLFIQSLCKTENMFTDTFVDFLQENKNTVKEEEMKTENEEEGTKEIPVQKTEHLSVKLEPDYFDEEEDDDDDYIERRKSSKSRKSGGVKRKRGSEGPKVCNLCTKTFVWRKNYLQHLNHCNPAQLQDEGLEYNADPNTKPKSEGRIYKRKTPRGPFHCEKCPHVFNDYRGFLSHIRAHDLAITAKEAAKAEKEDGEDNLKLKDLRDGALMRCEKCDLAYSAYQMYKNHMDQYHKKSLSCEECGLKFTLENTLTRHKLDYHTLYPKQCEQCSETCLTARELFEHLQSHNIHFIGKTFPCEICGKLLKNKYSLKAHVEAVHDKRKGGDFTCDQCGKILKSKASLDYHKRSVHTQEYPFRCEMCGNKYIKYNRIYYILL
ncbi:zinc finger protein 726, partial [Eurytemora carolleeae]|uniref:zinc finger protein 726 n=1 Tax=Eurytemora carolleeae TaxID=1294199 RepID=UPI000C760F8A